MEKHVSLSGILLITYGILHVLIVVIFLMLFLLPFGHFFKVLFNDGNFLIPFGSIIFVLFISFSIVGVLAIIAGIGIINFKEWARILAIIVSLLMLIHIPFGTFIGVYTMWALLQKETIDLFNRKK